MKKIIAAAIVALSLSGCVVYPVGGVYDEQGYLAEPYYVGYYNPGFGYWTGTTWDINFYAYGHRGYGHRYWTPRGYYRGHRH